MAVITKQLAKMSGKKKTNTCKTLCFANQKGGVGKTAYTYLLSRYLKRLGMKTLIIDSDPQNSFSNKALRNIDPGLKSFSNAIINRDLASNIVQINEHQYLCPSNNSMWDVYGVPTHVYKELINIDLILNSFDFILIDTPPSLINYTFASCVASDLIVIPYLLGLDEIKSTRFAIDQILKITKSDPSKIMTIANGVGADRDGKEVTDTKEYLELAEDVLNEYYTGYRVDYSKLIKRARDREEVISTAKSKVKVYNQFEYIFSLMTGHKGTGKI